MIRVTIDLIDTVDNSRSRCKGICYITNNFVTSLESQGRFGTYNYRITKWDPNINRVWRQGTVGPFDRVKRGPWDLLYLVLKSVLGDRNA
jgi:hypothetical protein